MTTPTDSTSSEGAGVTLSLCMIVRDSERTLRQALASAQPFMDEMIVVDTGSTDATRQLAQDLDARVFDFPWRDDFSAARNYSLNQATGDWIFWMDADDVLPPESGRTLRQVITEHPARDAAFWVTVEQQLTDENERTKVTRHGHVKLFPRHPEIRFRYRVHEQVADSIRQLGLARKMSGAVIRHTRRDTPQATAARMERNLRLLKLDLADLPDDPVIHLHLAMTYLGLPDHADDAVEYAQRCLQGLPPDSSARSHAYLVLAKAQRQAGDPDAEFQTCLEAHRESPDNAVILLILGGLYERRGGLQDAAGCYRRVIDSGKLQISMQHDPDILSRSAVSLGRLYIRMGRRGQAETVWREFLERHPEAILVQQALKQSSFEPYSARTTNSKS